MEQVLLTIIIAGITKKQIQNRKKKRSKWTKDWLLKRQSLSHLNLIHELRSEPNDFRNYLRMDEITYIELLNMVTPLIKKQDTVMRDAITPHERLAATLRFLATGRSYEDLKFSTIISPQALGEIIPETCRAIKEVLLKEYMKFPKSSSDWKAIADEFENRWQFPNCLGAVDGKHVWITPPKDSGSYFYNYKGFHSIVLLVLANANYEIILCDVGTNGRVSDGGVIENSKFYSKLKDGQLNIPSDRPLSENGTPMPYVLVGDEAFTLRTDFLKPYSQRGLDYSKRIYNYRLSRARRIVENVFGILAGRFRILHTPINIGVENTEILVQAICVLHNFLRRKCGASYTPPETMDTEFVSEEIVRLGMRPDGNALVTLQHGQNRNSGADARHVQDLYKDYFNGDGQVPWQDKMVNVNNK